VVAHSTDGKSPHLRVSSNAFEVAPPPVATSIGNPLSASPAPSIAAAATSAVSAAPLETSGDGADASDSLTNDSDSSSSRRRRRRSHIFPSGTASAAAVAAIVAAANASPTAAGSVTSPPSTPASLTSSSGGASGGGSRVSRPSSTRGDEEMRRSSRHRTHRGDHHHHHHHKQPQQQQQQQLPAASSPRLQSSDSGSGTKVEDEQAATNTGGTVDISIRGSGNLRRAGSLARSGSPRHESSPRSLAKASSPLGGEDDIAGGGGGGGDSNGSGSVSPQRIDLRASPGQQPPPLPPSPSFRPSVVEREPPPLPSSDTLGELPSHPKSLSLGDSARRASVLSAQSVPSASNDEDDIDFDVHSSESSAGDSHDESDSDADDTMTAGDANDEKPERTAAPAATRTTVAQRTVPVLSIAGAEKRKFAARGSVGGGVGDDDSSGGDEPGGESLSSHDMRFRRLMAMGAVGRAELLGVPALFLKAPTAKPDPRDINRPLPDTSQTLLHVAAVEGDLRGVRWLISHGALVDARDREGLTPLHYAIGLGRIGVARVLLEKEANPNAMTMVAWDAPAHFAARLPSSPELLALLDVLAENGALFDLPNKIDDTPLHEAAVGGERALLKWLLAAPGGRQLNVNAPNRFGDTPLHKAARAGNADAVRIMLRGGADINAVSESGTAADIAESCAHTHVADVLLEESGLRATPRAQPQYRIDMRPGNAEDISLRIDLSGLGMGNRFTPRTPRSPGSFGMRSRNKQWTRIMLRSPRPNNDKSDDSTPSSPSTGEPTSTVVSDGEQLSLLRTTNKKWVLRRPSPSTSNASSASNSGVWKKEFLVEPDAALDGDYVRSMLEKVDAEIASAGTDNSDDDDAIGEPAVTAAAATANSPTKDNASAATSATPPKKSEQEARNANAAAPQQPQAATGDAPQKKGSNRRRRRHRRPDDLPESATPAAVGATAAAAAAAAGATATPAAAAANSSSAATAVAAAVSTPMPTNATQQATVPSPPIEQASVICEGGACERCLAQSSSRCRWRCESLNRDVKLCSDCVRIMRETPNRCGLLLGTSDLTEFVGEKPASFDVHLLDEEELDIAATIQLDLQWDTWEFRDNFVRSDGQLERHKNCIGLSPFSPPVIVTFASELDKTARRFSPWCTRWPTTTCTACRWRCSRTSARRRRSSCCTRCRWCSSVCTGRAWRSTCAAATRRARRRAASAGESAPDFLAPLVGVSLGEGARSGADDCAARVRAAHQADQLQVWRGAGAERTHQGRRDAAGGERDASVQRVPQHSRRAHCAARLVRLSRRPRHFVQLPHRRALGVRRARRVSDHVPRVDDAAERSARRAADGAAHVSAERHCGGGVPRGRPLFAARVCGDVEADPRDSRRRAGGDGRDDELPAVGVRAARRARVWPADSAQLLLPARRLLSRLSAHENGQRRARGAAGAVLCAVRAARAARPADAADGEVLRRRRRGGRAERARVGPAGERHQVEAARAGQALVAVAGALADQVKSSRCSSLSSSNMFSVLANGNNGVVGGAANGDIGERNGATGLEGGGDNAQILAELGAGRDRKLRFPAKPRVSSV
jgi:ankyrin repeat protein